MKKVTIYDVAKKANVSLATVSRVINDSSAVSLATRERVLKAIADLNFVPNAVAQGLAMNKSTSIALIVPEASFSSISTIINGVVDVAHIYNYNVVLYSTNAGEFEVDKIMNNIIKNRFNGVIILNSELTSNALDQLAKYGIPVTIVGTNIKGKLRSSVFVDYEKITYQVIKDYLKQGKDKIFFIDGDYNRFIVEEMLIGIKKAYKEINKEFNGHLIVEDSYEKSYSELKNHLANNQADLYLASRDSLAISALNAALDLEIKIPEELEIIGYNNTKYSLMSRPALSTINVPLYEMGAIAARQITKMLNKQEIEIKNHEVKANLIHRSSTKE
ncbi:LacI family transcriptional regulator [Erysipelotrichaceae bacterium OttesenSCG-928-M19]|nr:LacI family transcriptional regulator [Erysipelotrichaceae bacterium OttesenSCG-928-M19]